jgi:DNA-binding CsgD family transcriptional regulator
MERRVLVAVDDVQWLDRPTEAVLGFAARRLRSDAAKLLLAERRDLDAPSASLVAAVGEDRARIVVGPLSLGATRRLIVSRVGVTIPRPSLVRLHAVAGGNPFYALEIAKAIAAGAAAAGGAPVPVPTKLHDLVGERLGRLAKRVRDALEVVAILAAPTVATVERVVPHGVERAVAAGVLERSESQLRFVHPLIAAAVAARMTPERRRSLHRRLAGVVADPEERARHLALGASVPSEEIGAVLEDAARSAAQRGTVASAVELSELAVRLTPPDARADAVRRRLLAAGHRLDAGDFSGARDELGVLIRELPPGDARAEALSLLSDAMHDDIDAQARLAHEALDEAQDEGLRARIRRELTTAAALTGDLRAALAHARAGVASAEATTDRRLLVASLAYLGLIETFDGVMTPGLLERAIDLEEDAGYLSAYESPSVVLAYRRVYEGRDFATARALLERACAAAAEHDDFDGQIVVLLHLAELENAAGRWERATEHASAGHEVAEQFALPLSQGALLHAWGRARAYLGDVENARALAERGLALARETKSTIHELNNLRVLAFLELSLGHAEAAAEIAVPVPERLAEAGYGRGGVAMRLAEAVEALVLAGDVQRARLRLDRLERLVEEVEYPALRPLVARAAGLLAASEGNVPRALETLEHALSLYDDLELPFERARTLLALGETRRRAKQKRAAHDALEAAQSSFDELGARLWAERARGELARISGRPPASDELTSTQVRVAELVAEGRTNREVAAELFVSERTVEGHLTRIYEKLGVRSRAELARRFAGVAG